MPSSASNALKSSTHVSDLLDGPLLQRLALISDPVCFLGPPGVGKTILAEQFHRLSGRTGPFLRVSAASLTDEMAFATFAGYRKGAFTSASTGSPGLLRSASGGTLFIDELGTASPRVQEVLLDVLGDQPLVPVGECRSIHVDVRFLCATNEHLPALVQQRRLRRDLVDRLGHFLIELRPLKERKKDILPLARRFCEEAWAEWHAAHRPAFAPDAAALLHEYDWPANIRELRAACRYAALLAAEAPTLCAEHFPRTILDAVRGETGSAGFPSSDDIRDALVQTKGNRAAAARRLRISRSALYEHLTLLGLSNKAAASV